MSSTSSTSSIAIPPQRRVRTAKRKVVYRTRTRVSQQHVSASASNENETRTTSSTSYIDADIAAAAVDMMQNNNTMQTHMYEPLRIRPILTDEFSQYLLPYERDYLLDEILEPAILAWSEALRLFPIEVQDQEVSSTNSTIIIDDKESDDTDTDGSMSKNLTIDKSQLWDLISCGPGVDSGYPSPLVPNEHFSVGVSDADLIVYISLSFTMNNDEDAHSDDDNDTSNSTSQGSNSSIGQSLEEALSLAQNSDSDISSGGDRFPSGSNEHDNFSMYPSVSPTDMYYVRGETDGDLEESISEAILNSTQQNHTGSTPSPSFISRGNISAPQCKYEDTIASASYCNTDQYDRPVAGSIHFCINLVDGGKDDFFHPSQRLTNIKATMHELAHILGFNPQSLAHFRNKDGTPRTPRNENGDVPDTEVACAGIVVENEPNVTATIPLPDPSILKFRSEKNGIRIASVVTENVKMVAQNHFDCQEMEGADLENLIINGSSSSMESLCIGSHWDRKIFKDDLMNPVIDPPSDASLLISPLTLAYFMDSGWYSINLDRVSPVSAWGRRKGCDFVDESAPCIVDSHVSQAHSPFYCNHDDTSFGCSYDLTRKASCGILKHVTEVGLTPKRFQYFGIQSFEFDREASITKEVWYGGNDPQLDFCPVYEAHQDSLCTSKTIPEKYVVSEIEEFGSENSRCISNGMCIPIACVMSDHSLHVKVDGEWKQCEYEGQKLESWWDASDYIICPDPWQICPTFFCPLNCLGTVGGVCDTTSGECICEVASSLYGSPSYAPCIDSGFLSNRVFANGQAILRGESASLSIYVRNSTALTDDIDKGFLRRVHKFFKDLHPSQLVAASFVAVLLVLIMCLIIRRWLRKRRLAMLVSDKRELISSIIDNLNLDEKPVNSKAVCEALGQEIPSDFTSDLWTGSYSTSIRSKSDGWSEIASIPSYSDEIK